MWHVIKSYVSFLWHSKNEYAVHSPFVFDFMTKCVYDKTEYPEYQILKKYRKSLHENHNFIQVSDFGAGSKIFQSDNRKIADIAKTAGISAKRAKLLFRLTNYFKPKNILEVGTSLGLASSALSLGNPSAKIITLEGCPETVNAARMHFEKFDLANINSVIGEFSSSFETLRHSPFDLIYFDGNHQKDATLDYFDRLLPTVTNDTVWIFDDIHWSSDMEQAWKIIKQNPKVSVTIDTFQWGLVFFRQEQQKQHFVLRA